MRRIILNRKYIAKLATRWTTGIFAFLGLIGTFASLSDLLDSSLSVQCRIGISIGILAGIWVISFLLCAVYTYRRRRIEVAELNNGHHIYVQYGDVFSEAEVLEPQKRRNIVIPVNRCFDTLVDNDLVSASTLHGIAMNRLYRENGFDPNTLEDAIKNNLNLQEVSYDKLSINDKRKGNLRRFSAGTVAEIKISEQCTYFFLGLSKFDKNLKAFTSEEEYVLAMMRLLEFCNECSQQFPVVMPLIGAGLSRTKKSEKDILNYIIGLVKMNRELINYDLHIIVRDNGKESIAIIDL